MTTEEKFPCRLRWIAALKPEQQHALPGSERATTAYFQSDSVDAMFSVVLSIPNPLVLRAGGWFDADIRLLVSQNLPAVSARLRQGTRLWICEGSKAVADCEIVKIPAATTAS